MDSMKILVTVVFVVHTCAVLYLIRYHYILNLLQAECLHLIISFKQHILTLFSGKTDNWFREMCRGNHWHIFSSKCFILFFNPVFSSANYFFLRGGGGIDAYKWVNVIDHKTMWEQRDRLRNYINFTRRKRRKAKMIIKWWLYH